MLISLLIISTVATFGIQILKVNASHISVSLTGRIFDEGIDKDGNGLFDFLQIKVEVNVTVAGTYYLSASGLKNATSYPYDYVSVSDNAYVTLNVGVQNVTLSFHGPTIHASGKTNLAFVSYVYISSQSPYYRGDSESNLALSRPYSYLEFDAPFTDMEAVFKVFPNGTVDMAGMVNATRMAYPAKGLNMSESFDVSTMGDLTTVSTTGSLVLPSWVASQWPYNSSTASMLAEYSKEIGTFDFGLNSTFVLPRVDPKEEPIIGGPFIVEPILGYRYYGGYPWNSSDFDLSLAYSNGILNGELDGSTVLPSGAALVFPFNVTDFSLEADYLAGLLKGNLTFHLLPSFPDFPLGDLTLEFEATRTQTTATGDLTVIYGTYPSYPDPIVIDEAFVDELIANITALEGTGPGSLYNMTNGIIELAPVSSITKTPLDTPPGATVNFDLTLNGDLIAFIAYYYGFVATNIAYSGVYHLLNATITSVNSASLQLSYAHASKTAILKVVFVDDLEGLLTNLFTFPADKTPYVVTSSSMRPTLEPGDLVLVKNITDASEIKAAPYNGDIIAFHKPSNPNEIIIHRAINKTFLNGTWYFQTKGDNNYRADYWYGPATHKGMVSEKLVFGKVVERIPWLGNLVFFIFWWQYLLTPAPIPSLPQPRDYLPLIKYFLALIKDFSLELGYTSENRTFDLKLRFVFDVQGLWDKIAPKLPYLLDVLGSSMKTFVTRLLENVYAEIEQADVWFTYQNDQADWQATFVVQGDFTRETNFIKNLIINEIVKQSALPPQTTPSKYQALWEFINATWLDVSDLKATYKIAEDSGFFSFEGFRASPPTDPINATSFKLYRFFNLTAPKYSWEQEFPTQHQRLKITIEGGKNATHMVTLYSPPIVPEPDFIAPSGKSMVWFNQTISSLKDLIFKVEPRLLGTLTVTTRPVAGEVFVNGTSWGVAPQSRKVDIGSYTVSFGAKEGYITPASQVAAVYENMETIVEGVYQPIPGIVVAEITNPELVNATNPFVVDAIGEAATSLFISEISDPVTIVVKNVTDPVGVDSPPGAWKVLGNYVQINVNKTDITVNATIRIYYTLEQLEASGLDESTLKIHYWNTTLNEWVPVESHVNTEEHYVWANIDHFSLWALMGQPPTLLWTQPQFLAIVGVAIAVIAIVTVAILMRKRKTPPPQP